MTRFFRGTANAVIPNSFRDPLCAANGVHIDEPGPLKQVQGDVPFQGDTCAVIPNSFRDPLGAVNGVHIDERGTLKQVQGDVLSSGRRTFFMVTRFFRAMYFLLGDMS